jgi:hypothetical protein
VALVLFVTGTKRSIDSFQFLHVVLPLFACGHRALNMG